MKKLISVLFALVLILILLPAPEARAVDYSICTICGQSGGICKPIDDYWHGWFCQNSSCSHYGKSYRGVAHSSTATCTEAGSCSVCGYSPMPALGHSFTYYISNNDASCTANGTKTAKCDRCDETDTIADIGSALGHDLIHHDAQSPTCTAVGWDAYDTCSRCDYSTYAEKPALGHDWVAPTCTEPGHCTRCPEPGEPALGHKWKAATCTEPKTCERCGATEGSPLSDGHKPGKTVIENEDIHCISDSSYDEVVYCTVCKKELSRKHITYKSSHDYKPWEWHETITRKYYKCTKCGNFYWLHNPESWNMKPGLVRYANGAAVDYKAYATGPDDNGVLTVTPIRHTERDSTDDISLYLTPDDVYVWTWEKMNRIELVRDRTVLAIDPREITPEMFGLKEGETPDFYVFTLTPSGKDGWQVRAEVLLGEKRLSAQELKGITLTAAGKETAITANGVYKAE